jgi:hypothetical protein
VWKIVKIAASPTFIDVNLSIHIYLLRLIAVRTRAPINLASTVDNFMLKHDSMFRLGICSVKSSEESNMDWLSHCT